MKISQVEALILRQGTVDASRADGGQDGLLIRITTDSRFVARGMQSRD
jgi:hypothetical protein